MKPNLKIVLVEDEPDIQEVSKLSLESSGEFKVYTCKSGNEAIEKIPQLMPDLVMLDMMMPGMDGITTLKKLRENSKLDGIPVVFMTAKSQASEMRHYIESGAVATISKPFDPLTLAGEVKAIWNKHKK